MGQQSDKSPWSSLYWEGRYAKGRNSGVGSYGDFAKFKARVLNDFVARKNIQKVIELGSGDGNQLSHAKYPEYHGFDVSETAVTRCKALFSIDASKSFSLLDTLGSETADMSMSLDVIYHLVEDEIFHRHMEQLFQTARHYVVIYASNQDGIPGFEKITHVRHRKFSDWVEKNVPEWRLTSHIPNKYPYDPATQQGSFADFYFYKRRGGKALLNRTLLKLGLKTMP